MSELVPPASPAGNANTLPAPLALGGLVTLLAQLRPLTPRGRATTEFWLTVLAIVLLTVGTAKGLIPGQWSATAGPLLIACYKFSRSQVKIAEIAGGQQQVQLADLILRTVLPPASAALVQTTTIEETAVVPAALATAPGTAPSPAQPSQASGVSGQESGTGTPSTIPTNRASQPAGSGAAPGATPAPQTGSALDKLDAELMENERIAAAKPPTTAEQLRATLGLVLVAGALLIGCAGCGSIDTAARSRIESATTSVAVTQNKEGTGGALSETLVFRDPSRNGLAK